MSLLTGAQVCEHVRQLLPAMSSQPDQSDNLIECGLDSLHVMRLVSQWRKAGWKVTFAQLMEKPQLSYWLSLLPSQADGAPAKAAQSEFAAVDDIVEPDCQLPFALTDVQHAYWIGRRDDQSLGGVGCHAYLELDGPAIDTSTLCKGWQQLVDHHPMLRACFDSQGQQRCLPQKVVELPVQDLRHLNDEQIEQALQQRREQLSHRRLVVEKGEVAGLEQSLLPGGQQRLHFDIDLLVADVLSLQILLRDLARCCAGKALAVASQWNFASYLHWDAQRRAASQGEHQGYWQQRLSELPSGPQLPLAKTPQQISKPRFSRRQCWLQPLQWHALKTTASRYQVTPAMVLATVFAETLARFSAGRHFLLNLPLFDRQNDFGGDIDHAVADFTSLLLLEFDGRAPCSFAERVQQLQRQFHRDIAHSDYSGVQVLRDLAREGGLTHSAAPVVFACNLGLPLLDETGHQQLGEVSYMISQTPQVWLDHQLYEVDGALWLTFDAVDELFPTGLMDHFSACYQQLVTALADAPQQWQQPANLALPPAQQQIRERVNQTAQSLPARTLHTAILLRDDNRTAVIDGEQHYSYQQLQRRVLQLATLLQKQGVRSNTPVAVSLPRGAGQVIAVLAVLAAGGCYVPISPSQPDSRRQRIETTAGISHRVTPELLGESLDCTPLALSELNSRISVDPAQRAYIIFTSGSTGEPKGVEISHQAACNTIDDINQRYQVTADDKLLAVSSLDFDLSVYDIFGPLAVGATVVCLQNSQRRDAHSWAGLVAEHRISIWNTVPMLLDMLLTSWENTTAQQALPLRLAMVSGDWVGLDLAPRLQLASDDQAMLVSLGGATEAAIWSNALPVRVPLPEHWRSVPYGFPLANQCYRVVDSLGLDCPDWVPGELWIGGSGVAMGYCAAPELTAERFVEQKGQRWYRTGDLGRYWPDGTLEFLGRQDHQVKVRGHRIELGEIEAALMQLPQIRQATVVTVGQPLSLAAALVGDTDDLSQISDALSQLLPDYMVPSSLVPIPALPLSRNGKVDRRLITEQLSAAHQLVSVRQPPQGKMEQTVARLWTQLLPGVEPGRDDDFFMLGGDSLLATRLSGMLADSGLQAEQPLQLLFAQPVLKDFAAGLHQSTMPQTAQVVLQANLAQRHQPFSLNEVQQAYWTGRSEDLPLNCGTHYLLELAGENVDLHRLAQAWNRLTERHEMLRVTLTEQGEQQILPDVAPLQIEVDHLNGADPKTLQQMMRQFWQRRNKYRAGSDRSALYRLYAIVCSNGYTRLGLMIDYLVLDGFSIRLLLDELARFYAEPQLQLPALEISFRDYLQQVQLSPDVEELARAEQWWLAQLPELPPAPALPLAQDPARLEAVEFYRRHYQLTEERWQRLRQLARQQGLTPSAVLLTLYAAVLSRWSGGQAHTLTLTLFDRRDLHPQINQLLGDFTTLAALPFRADTRPLAERIRDTQRRLAQVLEYRACSSIWLQREQAARNGLQAAALPVVFTSTLGLGDSLSTELPDDFPKLIAGGQSETPQVWLDHQLYEYQGGLFLHWDSVDALFADGVLDAMFGQYCQLIDQLVDNPACWQQPLQLMLPAAQQAVRDQVNQTEQPLPARCLHQRFFELAQQQPMLEAIYDGDRTVSYGELRYRALQLATLLQQQGVTPGMPVAVSLPRGSDQVIAVLGVLAAGGCYVPISPDQPDNRRQRIEATAGIAHRVDSALVLQSRQSDALAQPVLGSPQHSAYIIFTSGSTGEPKGVEVSHEAASNTIDDINQRYQVTVRDRTLAVSALDFDLSVYDIFGMLSAGAGLVVLNDEQRRDAQAWLQSVRRHGVTLWNSVPVLLDMLLTVTDPAGPPLPLRLAISSGDWVGLDLAERLHQLSGNRAELIAMGGATEAAIWSNALQVPRPLPAHWHSVPYGFPLANQQYRVMMRAVEHGAAEDCPDWVAGELWIGGRGVARGYRGAPKLTAERFVEQDGQRWYRTGDRGRYWPDGTLEFLGRLDHQVKIRGHRIELGEIETVLGRLPQIERACVLATGTPLSLVAALVCTDSIPLDEGQLQQALCQQLPDYMVPGRFIRLDHLPLSSNGKVDRKQIEQQLQAHPDRVDGQVAQSPLEQKLAVIWQQVLGCAHLPGRQEDFFMLGGDSLRATQIIEQLQQQGISSGQGLLRQLFSGPTIAALAQAIETHSLTSTDTGSAELHSDDAMLEEGVL